MEQSHAAFVLHWNVSQLEYLPVSSKHMWQKNVPSLNNMSIKSHANTGPCYMRGGKVFRITQLTTLQQTQIQFVWTLRTVVSRTAMIYRQLHTINVSSSFRIYHHYHRSLEGHCIINLPKTKQTCRNHPKNVEPSTTANTNGCLDNPRSRPVLVKSMLLNKHPHPVRRNPHFCCFNHHVKPGETYMFHNNIHVWRVKS